MTRYITHATLVLPDRVVEDGALRIEDGQVAAVCPGGGAGRELDARGALCLPGLVDLHCDALEKEIAPRPRVDFPQALALEASDRRNLNAGITTVFHAISFAGGEFGVRDARIAASLAGAVRGFDGLVQHRVHARYEVTDIGGEEPLAALLAGGGADLLSFMDHSPGQGQFRTLDAYIAYMVATYHVGVAEAEAIGASKVAARASAPQRLQRLAGLARRHGVAMASHDDDTPAKVAEMAALGVTVSEFPITLEAALAARAAGMATLFGAPNILRGCSASGNLRALDAVLAGCCGGLCADYHPPALLAAVLRLPDLAPVGLPLAVALASTEPARAAGLADRGAIAPGQRADLLLVRPGPAPRVEAVLVGGRLVLDTCDRQVAACA